VFKLSLDNDQTASSAVSGSVLVIRGHPSYMAVLVNSSNFAAATWTLINSYTFTATLPGADGRFPIWVGLRGLAPDSKQTWSRMIINHDTTPPTIVVTNPVLTTLSQKLLQVQGYSPEPLKDLTYDLNNAAGITSSIKGVVSRQNYDTNLHAFTTNYFQCFDIGLEQGENIMTLHCTDLAGNAATKTITYTLVSDVVPPLITLDWPADGTKVYGEFLNAYGWVDDPSAKIVATISSPGQSAISVPGLVERSGRFWIGQLPLGSGENSLDIQATDSWSNVSHRSLKLYKSDVSLTMYAPDELSLFGATVDVSGTVGSGGATVWVNGKQGENSGGSWTAFSVPVPLGGTATFQVTAYPGGQNPVPDPAHPGTNPHNPLATEVSLEPDKPSRVFIERHNEVRNQSWNGYEFLWNPDWALAGWSTADTAACQSHAVFDSAESYGDMTWDGKWNAWSSYAGGANGSSSESCSGHITWPPAPTEALLPGYMESIGSCDYGIHTGPFPAPIIAGEYCEVSDPKNPAYVWWDVYVDLLATGFADDDYSRNATTSVTLYTGGKGVPKRKNLFVVTAPTQEILEKRAVPPYVNGGDVTVPFEQITVGDVGRLGNDGRRYVVLEDSAQVDVTPRAAGKEFYIFNVFAYKYPLRILANGKDCQSELLTWAPLFTVGEGITLAAAWDNDQAPPDVEHQDAQWTLAGNYKNDVRGGPMNEVSEDYYANEEKLTHDVAGGNWWVSGGNPWKAYPISFAKNILFRNGQEARLDLDGLINVFRPASRITATTGAVSLDANFVQPDGTAMRGLHYGVLRPHGTPGILSYSSGLPPGDFQWVQRIKSCLIRYRTASGDRKYYQDGNGLDKSYPYGTEADGAHEDSPGISIDPERFGTVWLLESASFETWLEFRPDSASHWVPLRRIEWGWGGEAVLSNGQWILANPHDVANPSDVEEEVYPQWSHIIDLRAVPPYVPEP
jgi:hypothetical protein